MASLLSPLVFSLLSVSLQILAFSLPPFRYRSAIFVPLLVITAVYTHSGPVSTDPRIVYAIGTLWPAYISAIDRLLFGTPELQCWADGDAPGEAATWGFGWRKIKWSVNLWLDPRGVGWNFRVKGVRAARKESRWGFVVRKILWAAVLTLACDFCYSRVFEDYLPDDHGVHLSTATGGLSPVWIARKAVIAFITWWGLEVSHVLWAAQTVAFGLYTPEDWPPLFGCLEDLTTVGNFWGTVWHQLLRRTLAAYSNATLRALRIPRTSPLSHPLALLIVFGICGLGHALPLVAMRDATQAHLNSVVIFFLLQAVAIYVESIVIAVYQRVTGDTGNGGWWRGAVGRVWCVLWFATTLPLFWDSMIATGVFRAVVSPAMVRELWKGKSM